VRQLEGLGAPPNIVERLKSTNLASVDFEVIPENWPVVELFLMSVGDLRVSAGLAGTIYQGVPLASIEALFNIYSVPPKRRPKMLQKLKLMEQGALSVLNEQE